MPVDGGLIVGYLTAALVRGGMRLADRRLDSLLDRLTTLVVSRMGRGPIAQLTRSPDDDLIQRDVGMTIDRAVSVDRDFARDLAQIAAALDERGGRQILNQVYAQMNVQAFDHGTAIGGDFTYFKVPDPTDYSDAPTWIKLCIGLGSVLAVAALGIFGYTLFTYNPDLTDPEFGDTPPEFGVAGALFFVGFVILGFAALGRALSRRR